MLLSLLLSLSLIIFSLPATDKTQYFDHLSFNSTLQLIGGISRELQKILKYFNGTEIVAYFIISLSPSAIIFPNN